MKRRTEAEATALIAQPRTTKPRAKPKRREFLDTAIPVDEAMSAAGFHVCDFSRTVRTHGIHVSAVTTGVPDRYYWREDGLSVWVELKAAGGHLRPAQAEFLVGHKHNAVEAVCWDSGEACRHWLEAYGIQTP